MLYQQSSHCRLSVISSTNINIVHAARLRYCRQVAFRFRPLDRPRCRLLGLRGYEGRDLGRDQDRHRRVLYMACRWWRCSASSASGTTNGLNARSRQLLTI